MKKTKKKGYCRMESSDLPHIKISEDMPETQASKKQKVFEKSVVTVKIDGSVYDKKQKSEGPPSDCWSWRKYGQKPIKGSPYPRGYYRCSTSKSCSAKKQVERCKTDASLLIVTYTYTHNHPSPKEPKQTEDKKQENLKIQINENKEADSKEEADEDKEIHIDVQENGAKTEHVTDFHYYQSPFNLDHQDIISNIFKHEEGLISPFTEKLESLIFDEKLENPLYYPHLMTFSSTSKNEENDFYEELGELPISSSLTRFMRSNLFEDRILSQ